MAKEAGVSKSTVSLVLQGSKAVKEETRLSVRKAMADIGYVYNRSAATLRSASSGLIGLVINDMRNPFFTEFAASLQMALADQGFATVLANTDEDADLQARMIGSQVEHGVSGLIISPAYGGEKETLAVLDAAVTPTLQVFRRFDHKGRQFPFLAPDHARGSTLATQHLIDAGCKKIAFLGGLDGRPVTKERMEGYLSVLQAHDAAPLVVTGEATRAFGKAKVAELRAAHPTLDGILCFNDLVALGVLSSCAEHVVSVGKDLKVVGICDIEDCRDNFPPLSSVSCRIADFAEVTAERMLSWVRDGKLPTRNSRSPVELVARASSVS